jgi:hypothetical protein
VATNQIDRRKELRPASTNKDKYSDLGNHEQETQTAQPRSKKANFSLK